MPCLLQSWTGLSIFSHGRHSKDPSLLDRQTLQIIEVRARPRWEAGVDAFTLGANTVSLPAEGFTKSFSAVFDQGVSNEEVYGGTAQVPQDKGHGDHLES